MAAAENTDDAELLGSPDPDGAAFGVFYRRHVQAVLAFLARSGTDPWTAADVTSETFVTALRIRDQFDRRRGDARAWLIGIARNRLLEARRRTARQADLTERLGFERIELTERDVADYWELQGPIGTEQVEEAIKRLPPKQAAAVRLRLLHGKSYVQVADELHVSEESARQNVSRGLAALRNMLQGENAP